MSNIRPDWCPYPDCQFILQFQQMMCVGKLPEPEMHDPDEFDKGFNTHRQCLNEAETGHGIHDLKLNKGDAWLMKKLLDEVKE